MESNPLNSVSINSIISLKEYLYHDSETCAPVIDNVTLGTNKSGCYTEVTILYRQVSMQTTEWNLIWDLKASGCYRLGDQVPLYMLWLLMHWIQLTTY